jgi:hypothetical protein
MSCPCFRVPRPFPIDKWLHSSAQLEGIIIGRWSIHHHQQRQQQTQENHNSSICPLMGPCRGKQGPRQHWKAACVRAGRHITCSECTLLRQEDTTE